MRALLLIHRYLGIAIGLVMAMWCLSGIVMMYVRYPELDDSRRIAALEPIALHDCCNTDKVAAMLSVEVVDDFNIEMVAGRPVLRAVMATGERHVFDLRSGEHIEKFAPNDALAVVARHAGAHSMESATVESIERDQWTVSGAFNRDRPLYKVTVPDDSGSEWYVSSATGALVQVTTQSQRFWNWLGSVPHWLYPTVLRQHPAIWAQVVIWLSLAGAFLTAMGLYIGIAKWRAMQGKALSPYRGVHLWHHIGGLFFGVLMLTWVTSGLISMSPWGLFEGAGPKAERERVRDAWITGGQIAQSIAELQRSSATATLRRIEAAPLHGQLYLLLNDGATSVRVLANSLQAAPITPAQLTSVAQQLRGKEAELLIEGDDYYYSGHETRALPVYRVIANNTERTRYYLHPVTADVIAKFDGNARAYRWWFEGLHRFDFTKWLRVRPWWDALVLPLMLGVTIACVTGAYLGYRRVVPRKR